MKLMFAGAVGVLMAMPIAVSAQQAQPATPSGASTPAPQSAATPAVGATVYGPDGSEVGKVEALTAQGAIVFTGKHRVPVPLDRFGTSDQGPTLGLTRVALDAAMDQAQAQAVAVTKTRLVAGTEVRGVNGNVLGSVVGADAEHVTLKMTSGEVKLPVGAFGADPNSPGLVIGLSAEELEKAIAASK